MSNMTVKTVTYRGYCRNMVKGILQDCTTLNLS